MAAFTRAWIDVRQRSGPNRNAGMSEPFQELPRKKSFRLWGHLLLWVGFVWLVASRTLFATGVLAKRSRFDSDGVPRKESYTRAELHDAIYTLSGQIRDDPPWIYTPAILMLGGGLLLGRACGRR